MAITKAHVAMTTIDVIMVQLWSLPRTILQRSLLWCETKQSQLD